MTEKYKGFDKNLTKNDLNREELECYNKLMEGIKNVSQKEKEEIAHLMGVFLETEEKVHTKCVRCGKEFKDENLDDKKIYCDECLKKMWS